MSKQDRVSLIRFRFAVLAASCASAQASQSAETFHPSPRLPVLSSSSPILSPAERARLAREVAPFQAFRADVAALPLRLMPAPFFLS